MATNVLIIGVIIFAIIMIGLLAAIISWYKKVPQGQALIRTGSGGTHVAIDKGMFVIPILHIVEQVDLRTKAIEIARLGTDSLSCKDNVLATIKIIFYLQVNKNPTDIIAAAQSLGAAGTSDAGTVTHFFKAKFSEALKTVCKHYNFSDLYGSTEKFKQEILMTIGTYLNGYALDDCVIDHFERTSTTI